FRGETIVETLLIKSKSPPPALSSFMDRAYPDGLDKIVEVCLALAPGDRFAKVEELEAKLSEVFGGLEIKAADEAEHENDRERGSAPDRSGRRSGLGISVLVSGFLLFGLGYWLLSSSSEHKYAGNRTGL